MASQLRARGDVALGATGLLVALGNPSPAAAVLLSRSSVATATRQHGWLVTRAAARGPAANPRSSSASTREPTPLWALASLPDRMIN